MSVAGHLVGVSEDQYGSSLSADLTVGDTVLNVDSTVDFDEEFGGTVLINGSKLDYLAFDDPEDYDTDGDGPTTLTLTAASAIAADAGDRVFVFDPTTGEDDPVTELIALVTIDDRDPGDALPARVRAGLVDQLDSDFETYLGKAVELDVVDGELVLVDILGSKRTGAVKFMQDALTVTGSGEQTLDLTYRPLLNSEHLYWDGVYQPGSEWSRDQWTVTIPDGGGVIEVGDELVMEYAYTDPTPRPIVPASMQFIGTVNIPTGTTAVTPPTGSQVGDLFVFMSTSGVSFGSRHTECTDSRVVQQLVTEPDVGSSWPASEGVAWGWLTTLDDVAVLVDASDNSVQGNLSVYRVTGYVAAVFSHGDLTNTAPVDCIPDPAPGQIGLLAVATNVSVSALDAPGWGVDQVAGALGLWDATAPTPAHVLNGTGELAIWTAMWIGISDA